MRPFEWIEATFACGRFSTMLTRLLFPAPPLPPALSPVRGDSGFLQIIWTLAGGASCVCSGYLAVGRLVPSQPFRSLTESPKRLTIIRLKLGGDVDERTCTDEF